MTRMLPQASIGMPVYNGARFVRQALDSIVGQTFEDWELIISDNASTDETEDICQSYTHDRRIRYERNATNIGAKANFNRVYELAAGRYFKWAAHDDVCDPRFLARTVDVLDHDDSIVLCHARTSMIDHAGHAIHGGALRRGSMLDANGRTVRLADYDPPTRRLASTDPRRRFRDILLHTHWCFEIFGLIRRETMRRSAGQGLYYGSDKTLLAELALRGDFGNCRRSCFSGGVTPERPPTWRHSVTVRCGARLPACAGLLRPRSRAALVISTPSSVRLSPPRSG